jgi:DNA-binding protein YbaB
MDLDLQKLMKQAEEMQKKYAEEMKSKPSQGK